VQLARDVRLESPFLNENHAYVFSLCSKVDKFFSSYFNFFNYFLISVFKILENRNAKL
jgi:hypothetical protein